MDIIIDYDTICIECQAKGYFFGYGLKTIEYKNKKILDSPQPHLNGACIYFEYENKPVLLKSTENSHYSESGIEDSKFIMMNARTSKNSLISRFTYSFSFPVNRPEEEKIPQIIEYVDVYRFPNNPYFFIFYTFRNLTGKIIRNFNFYQFYDFDIYGQESYSNDVARFDSKSGVIYQYDNDMGIEKSLIAGIGSSSEKPPFKFECNIPQDIFIFEKNQTSLRNYAEKGPSDCAIALQWNYPIFNQKDLISFPIMIIAGFGKNNFFKNVKLARNDLDLHQKSVLRTVENKTRQKIDPKLLNLSFSQKKWCK
ncbi:hypothetical protein DSAG12_02345 [Promethearchaeum syntrophicum]|uniref:Uncharacterized protein n=1 Tax=Promethearchaeum syntrophicum TaxID=2594042 RepID=A0A5B9DC00_9ARCH|nr:hypothetical protein [Candidatus Prometheoarchaeum syntrophicum]QEE16515.1 hypothetical protein DSAG12_02345 [Candidatus Prometheoarchaeum syntrophicum]